MKKIILLFGFDDMQGAQQAFALQELTRKRDVIVRTVRKEDYHRTILSLVQDAAAADGQNTGMSPASGLSKATPPAGGQGKATPTASGQGKATPTASGQGKAASTADQGRKLPARMLLFAAFTDQELYSVLDLCPACGITRDDLKAAMTPANSRWDAFRLCENIQEEHRRLRQQS